MDVQTTANGKAIDWRRYTKPNLWMIAIICMMIALLHVPFVHESAASFINRTLVEATGIFALSQLINGLISALQTVELSAVVASIGVGELLDPINDTVERFSSGMWVAVVSLMAQSLALGLFKTNAITWVLTGLGAVTVAALLWAPQKIAARVLQIFVVTFVVRYFFVVVALITMFLSQAALQSAIDSQSKALDDFKVALDQLTGAELDTVANDDEPLEIKQQRLTDLKASNADLACVPGCGVTARRSRSPS